jgi:hypothetical protein
MSFNGTMKALVDTTSPDTLAAIEEDLSTMYVIPRTGRIS